MLFCCCSSDTAENVGEGFIWLISPLFHDANHVTMHWEWVCVLNGQRITWSVMRLTQAYTTSLISMMDLCGWICVNLPCVQNVLLKWQNDEATYKTSKRASFQGRYFSDVWVWSCDTTMRLSTRLTDQVYSKITTTSHLIYWRLQRFFWLLTP